MSTATAEKLDMTIRDLDNQHEEQTKVEAADCPLMGLCVNCEERAHCAHAKKTGGVWHCEMFV